MNNVEDKRSQRAKLLASLAPATKDYTSDYASIPGQDIVDHNGDRARGLGNNDGSESGGLGIPGGVIDLESARQQYKGLTGEIASAKWSAADIDKRIQDWRLGNAPPAPVGEGAGEQTGPIVEDPKAQAEAEKKAEPAIKTADASAEAGAAQAKAAKADAAKADAKK